MCDTFAAIRNPAVLQPLLLQDDKIVLHVLYVEGDNIDITIIS